MRRLETTMLRCERYGAEVFLTISCAWAASRLLTPPPGFAGYASGFAFMQGLQPDETPWGIMAAIGVALQVAGLLLSFVRPEGLALRCLGLAVAGCFWTVLGASFAMGNPRSIAAVPLILMGFCAWWTLVRFPTSMRGAPP